MSIVPSLFGGRRSNIFDPFSLDIWDPFKDFPISSSSGVSRETSALVNARVDWKETPEAHVEVEDGNILQIIGERNVEKEDKNDKWHRVERSSGKFTRRFRLPENAKMDEVKAAMENGVLTITVPKEEVKKPDVKSIEISG
uniref:Putative HSP20-like chaperone n=1 Tax=Helianthus annuus TaxID=4232 RepID=A0A251VPP8_HELAN